VDGIELLKRPIPQRDQRVLMDHRERVVGLVHHVDTDDFEPCPCVSNCGTSRARE
jgi:hypothetical protein